MLYQLREWARTLGGLRARYPVAIGAKTGISVTCTGEDASRQEQVISTPPFISPPPKVTLTNGFSEPFDNAVATARTCYNSRIITSAEVRKDEKARPRCGEPAWVARRPSDRILKDAC